jgi:probable DNA metabolism protein
MTEPQAAQWDGSLESLFAVLDEACRRGMPPRRVERTGPPEGTPPFAGAGDGAGPSLQPELFAAPETVAAVPPERAADREEPCGGPAFPSPELSPPVFPELRNSGGPSGSLAAALLYELSANAFSVFVHAWMSEAPMAAEIVRFAWKVITAARQEVFQGGPPEPTAGALWAAAPHSPAWATRPEARLGAEKAASDRGDPDTRRVLEAAYKVVREIDRLRGLLRFKPCFPGGNPAGAAPPGGGPGGDGPDSAPVYAARCSPDHHVLPGLADHFTQRFGECPWAVIDEKRNLVLAREPGGEARIFPLSPGRFPAPGSPGPDCGPQFDRIEDLWRNYHRSINNPDRNNPALQRQFLPRRYWKYLPEVQ